MSKAYARNFIDDSFLFETSFKAREISADREVLPVKCTQHIGRYVANFVSSRGSFVVEKMFAQFPFGGD